MNIESYLNLIGKQRHAFANHLQVITGYLQLDRIDEANKYIQRVGMELVNLGNTGRLKIPELALVLLCSVDKGAKHEVTVELAVESDFAGCVANGPLIGEIVEQVFDSVLESLPLPNVSEKNIKITLYSKHNQYICCFHFPEPDQATLNELENSSVGWKTLLEPHGARLCWPQAANDNREISIIFPSNE